MLHGENGRCCQSISHLMIFVGKKDRLWPEGLLSFTFTLDEVSESAAFVVELDGIYSRQCWDLVIFFISYLFVFFWVAPFTCNIT